MTVTTDRLYIMTGFVWLIFGMVFGIYLGVTEQLNFSNSHAHANLIGFVISILFGLLCRNWPALLASKLALLQFLLFEIGAVLLVAGKYNIDGGGKGVLTAPGSIMVVLGALLMLWIFATATDGRTASKDLAS